MGVFESFGGTWANLGQQRAEPGQKQLEMP